MPEGSDTSVVLATGGGGGHNSNIALAEISGAEIMRVGTWNGNRFTLKDIQDIASAAPEVGYVPPLKVGHDESIGARAWGWIRNLRVAGDKLIADLMDIPETLAAIIRERGYDQLSAEVYLDLDRNGKRFRRALKAVALLGAEVPAVSNLKPLRELFADDSKEYRVEYSDPAILHGVTVIDRWASTVHGYPAEAICFTNQPEGGRTMPNETTGGSLPDRQAHSGATVPDLEVSKLREEAAAMRAKADAQATALAEQKAAADAQAAELAALKERSEAQAAELKTQKEETLALQAKNREIALTAKLDAWKGPPAFRPFLEVFYRTATESPRTVKLSLETGKPEDISLEIATEECVDCGKFINAWTEHAFGNLKPIRKIITRPSQ